MAAQAAALRSVDGKRARRLKRQTVDPGPSPSAQSGRGRVWPVVKRALDVTAASVGLVVLSPLLAVAAIAIRLDSPGPICFASGGWAAFPAVRNLQISHDGRRCTPVGLAADRRRRSADYPAGPSVAQARSTSFRSLSTCFAAR